PAGAHRLQAAHRERARGARPTRALVVPRVGRRARRARGDRRARDRRGAAPRRPPRARAGAPHGRRRRRRPPRRQARLAQSAVGLFEAFDLGPHDGEKVADPRVRTLVKADLQCASVAAASVLAKTERDGLMTSLARQYPAYGWDQNKGYGAAAHVEALRGLG